MVGPARTSSVSRLGVSRLGIAQLGVARSISLGISLGVGLALAWSGCAPPPARPIQRPSLRLDEAPLADRAAPGVHGVVVDPSGAPVSGATVLAILGDHDDDPTPMVRTTRDGSFHFEGLTTGTWRFTASSLRGTAIGAEPIEIGRAEQRAVVDLHLEPATHVLVGTVGDELGGPVRGVTVTLDEVSARPGSRFGVFADDDGDFRVGISTAHPYLLGAIGPGRARVYGHVGPGETEAALQLGAAAAERPPDVEIARWLRAEAKALATSEPGVDDADLAPLAAMLGRARIIGLGEATHGSHEIQNMKRRVIERLVDREGVTVFALEAGMIEARAVDDYVARSRGDARSALHGLQTFSWETEEMLGLLESVHDRNVRRAEKVRFEGFDVTAFSAIRSLIGYLRKVDPGVAENLEATTTSLADPSSDATYAGLGPAEHAAVRGALEHAGDRLDQRKKAYVAKLGAAEWDAAVRQLAAVRQAEAVFRDPLARDAAMAANVDAMVARYPAGTRFVLWMHNAHASAEAGRVFDMGRILRETYRDEYVVVGFAFGRGGFRAYAAGDPRFEVRDLAVGDPLPEGFDAALGLAGAPLFAIDLRTARGAVEEWLDSPLLAWSIGARFADDRGARVRVRPGEAYDAVVYIDRLTPTRPLQERKRPRSVPSTTP